MTLFNYVYDFIGLDLERFRYLLTEFRGDTIQYNFILFNVESMRSGCPVSRARGSCLKCSIEMHDSHKPTKLGLPVRTLDKVMAHCLWRNKTNARQDKEGKSHFRRYASEQLQYN